jgi:hypothetical protein
MSTERQREIVNKLFDFQGGRITDAQLEKITKDRAEKHFAICKLRGLGITLSTDYRTLSFGERANEQFRRRNDLEKELTIRRKQERQHKRLLRPV